MRLRSLRSLRRGAWLMAGLCVCAAHGLDVPNLGEAKALYRQKRYAEAKALLVPLAEAQPPSADACYYLGMTIFRSGGRAGLDAARKWIGRAVGLAPRNFSFLADYAGVTLLLADRDSSFSLAMEGRDAMARAVAGDPDDLDARQGLMRFYATAPWPLGDAAKAMEQAAEIARRDPRKGAGAYRAIAAIFARKGRKEQADSALRDAQSLAAGHPEW